MLGGITGRAQLNLSYAQRFWKVCFFWESNVYCVSQALGLDLLLFEKVLVPNPFFHCLRPSGQICK